MASLLNSFSEGFTKVLQKTLAAPYRAACGHRKYGLKYDDLLMETPEVTEAIRRLPVSEQIARMDRLKVAFDLSVKSDYLPEEKWLKPEEDLPYLRPIVEEVVQEKKEREAFRK